MHQSPRRLQRFQAKNKRTTWVFHPFFLCAWVVLCALLSWSLWRSVDAMTQSIQRQEQAKQKLKEEEAHALDLIDKLNKADTSYAKEKIIRDELQMQLPGETVLEIPKK